MRSVGRYELWSRIAAGGMGAVHLGCVRGEAGFRRAVAIKSMHAAIASDPGCVAAFIDEARLAARLRHPNLVSTIDVAAEEDELILVMDYVHGESLARLVHGVGQLPIGFGVSVMIGALRGLHAAHETTGDDGKPLELVHRDVSPQNIIVGVDGVARITDFGVAKAAGRIHLTGSGAGVKGKLAYMAPEQLAAEDIDRRTDVFAIGIVLWELLTGVHLFYSANDGATVKRIVSTPIDPPSKHRPDVPPELEAIVMRALNRDMNARYPTAREMADALEATGLASSVSEIGEWVTELAAEALAERGSVVSAIERSRASTGDLQRFAEKVADASARAPKNDSRPTGMIDPPTTNGASIMESQGTFRATPGRVVAAAVAFVVVLLGGAVLVKRLRATPPEEPPPAVAAAPLPPPAPTEPPADPELALDLPPTPPAPGAHSGRRRTPRAPASARPTANCADPYTRDNLGRKIYKRECLND